MLKIKNGKFIIKFNNSHEQLVQIKTQVRIQCSLLFYQANAKLKCKTTAQTDCTIMNPAQRQSRTKINKLSIIVKN